WQPMHRPSASIVHTPVQGLGIARMNALIWISQVGLGRKAQRRRKAGVAWLRKRLAGGRADATIASLKPKRRAAYASPCGPGGSKAALRAAFDHLTLTSLTSNTTAWLAMRPARMSVP